MGIDDVVVSPTFTLLNYYENTIPLQHFDFYRLEEEYELDDLGFEDYLDSGVTVIDGRKNSRTACLTMRLSSLLKRRVRRNACFTLNFPEAAGSL